MTQHSTKLNSRVLWYDGSSTVSAATLQDVFDTIPDYEKISVDEITPAIEQYNKLVPQTERLKVKVQCDELPSITTLLPDYVTALDLESYFLDAMCNILPSVCSDDYVQKRAKRVITELQRYEAIGKTWMLRLMIHVVDTFKREGVVWGVGRGSSVSSYLLFLIGVHDVDSVQYDLDLSDFI